MGMNDAASGVILMSEEKAKEVGAPILARIVSVATTGVRPEVMGIGPISASQKALMKAGLTIDDIDLFEINEAFAAQCIACAKTLRIDEDKLNVNGSGISLRTSGRSNRIQTGYHITARAEEKRRQVWTCIPVRRRRHGYDRDYRSSLKFFHSEKEYLHARKGF